MENWCFCQYNNLKLVSFLTLMNIFDSLVFHWIFSIKLGLILISLTSWTRTKGCREQKTSCRQQRRDFEDQSARRRVSRFLDFRVGSSCAKTTFISLYECACGKKILFCAKEGKSWRRGPSQPAGRSKLSTCKLGERWESAPAAARRKSRSTNYALSARGSVSATVIETESDLNCNCNCKGAEILHILIANYFYCKNIHWLSIT